MDDFQLKHILIVDDEEEYQAMICEFLKKMDLACESASNAFEGLDKLHSQRFDLVISDIRMEGKDGLQFMQEAREIYPHLEFIIMTGHAGEYSYSDIIAAGATDFISKPFELEKLKSKLERIHREKLTLHKLHEANVALRRELEVNASISEVSKNIIGSLSIDGISRLVLDHACHLTESPLGFVGYIDPKTGDFVSTTIVEDIQDECRIANRSISFEEFGGLWGWVLKHRRSLLSNTIQDDGRSSAMPGDSIPVHRFLSVPAMSNEALLGQVALANSKRDYTKDDLIVVENLAAVYGLAVQRKWTEEALQEANEHLENVFENAAEAIGIVDRHGMFVKWNKAAEELYGYSFEELKGKPFSDLYADKDRLGELVDQLRHDGFVYGYEIDVRRKDGHIVPFRISIRLLRDKENNISGSVGVATDLSDIKDTLTQLTKSNQQLKAEMAERDLIAQELRKTRDELEKLVVERTERLSKAGALLKRSIDRFKEITEE